MKFINKFSQFMIGRYGVDELYYFNIYLYVLLVLVDFLFKIPYFFFVELFVFVFTFFRVFSKNKKRRKKENQIYLKIRNFLLKPFQNIKRNWKDRKDYIYKKCHKCKTTLRLPIPTERGIKHVTCPKCKKKLTVLCLRKEKIEIIKANGEKRYY